MTLFSLILEILADAMMLLSAPRSLDRVLTRLCKPHSTTRSLVFFPRRPDRPLPPGLNVPL